MIDLRKLAEVYVRDAAFNKMNGKSPFDAHVDSFLAGAKAGLERAADITEEMETNAHFRGLFSTYIRHEAEKLGEGK